MPTIIIQLCLEIPAIRIRNIGKEIEVKKWKGGGKLLFAANVVQ